VSWSEAWVKKSKNKALSSWTSSPLNIGPIGCPETSVQNYHSVLRNIPEEHRFLIHLGGRLKSCIGILLVSSRGCVVVASRTFFQLKVSQSAEVGKKSAPKSWVSPKCLLCSVLLTATVPLRGSVEFTVITN
jgi:hypothetical protein